MQHMETVLVQCFTFGWQGIHLRVVGVCDSKCLVVAPDVFSMELSDNLLLEVCRVKSDSSSLLTLSSSGTSMCRCFLDKEK